MFIHSVGYSRVKTLNVLVFADSLSDYEYCKISIEFDYIYF